MKSLLGLFLLVGTLNGCAIVYQQDIQQGNFLNEEKINLVELGMTREQVAFALGTPMVNDPFNTDRWDYTYSLDSRRQKLYAVKRVTIHFDNQDHVREIEQQD
ncbi:MAG: outer membrane protein assembly factor BamE [Gammaproteobacteria bacterium]